MPEPSTRSRYCIECGKEFYEPRKVTCSIRCRNQRTRRQSRDSARRRYPDKQARRSWITYKPMHCLTCGVELERKPNTRTPLRCPAHQAEHDAHRRTEKERRRRFRRHGLTEERYLAILRSQGDACAICGATEPNGGRGGWHIDHDHSCCSGPWSCGNCIRGILCGRCNNMIGYADERPEVLAAAADYVRR